MVCELLPRQVHVAASQPIPVVESLSGTIAVEHFGLQQLAAQEVV